MNVSNSFGTTNTPEKERERKGSPWAPEKEKKVALGAPEKEKKWCLGGETWRNTNLPKSAGTMTNKKKRQSVQKKPNGRIQVLS